MCGHCMRVRTVVAGCVEGGVLADRYCGIAWRSGTWRTEEV